VPASRAFCRSPGIISISAADPAQHTAIAVADREVSTAQDPARRACHVSPEAEGQQSEASAVILPQSSRMNIRPDRRRWHP
jgi:hypothetical protein